MVWGGGGLSGRCQNTYVWLLETWWDLHLRGLSNVNSVILTHPCYRSALNEEFVNKCHSMVCLSRLPNYSRIILVLSPLYPVLFQTTKNVLKTEKATCFCFCWTRTRKKRRRRCPRLTHLQIMSWDLVVMMMIMINPLRSKESNDDAEISIENFHRAVDSRELWIADAGVHVWAFLGGRGKDMRQASISAWELSIDVIQYSSKNFLGTKDASYPYV